MFYVKKYLTYCTRRMIALYNRFFYSLYYRKTLTSALDYCSNTIPFYEGKGHKLGNYPLITKRTVRDNLPFFYKKHLLEKECRTSGTTGTPGIFFRDFTSIAAEQYFQSRYFGWDKKYRVIFRGGKIFDIDIKSNKIFKKVPLINEMYVSNYYVNDETLDTLVRELQTIDNKCLYASPSSAYLLAEFCIRKDMPLTFDFIATSSEMLLQHQIDVIEQAFRCPIKDFYGQAERVAALYRCEYGHYHAVEHYSHIEFLPVRDNIYEIAGTTLHNKVMPLVRYRTGDYVELSSKPCRCGNKGVNITTIHGRSDSYIELPIFRFSGSLLTFPFRKATNIIESQIVQTRNKDIVIKIVRNEFYTAQDEQTLLNEIHKYLPPNLCSIEYVDRIERDQSGKFNFVVNEGLAARSLAN